MQRFTRNICDANKKALLFCFCLYLSFIFSKGKHLNSYDNSKLMEKFEEIDSTTHFKSQSRDNISYANKKVFKESECRQEND